MELVLEKRLLDSLMAQISQIKLNEFKEEITQKFCIGCSGSCTGCDGTCHGSGCTGTHED